MSVDFVVISIGTLSHNRLWGESSPVRTSHATTTLVVADKRMILVDPSLPATVLAARFNERTGAMLDNVTDVFCTTLRPVHRRAIEALSHADWWTMGTELESYRDKLARLAESAQRLNDDEAGDVEQDLQLLSRFRPAPDKFSQQVHLYPLVGATIGSAGLLLTPATTTIAIAGDAAITRNHLEHGQVWQGCSDVEAAQASMSDLLEIADVIIPGHDNVTFSPSRWL